MKYTAVWDQADVLFNVIFLFELLTNSKCQRIPTRGSCASLASASSNGCSRS